MTVCNSVSTIFITAVVILAVIFTIPSVHNELIISPPITDWGEWGQLEHCPPGRYAQGFQIISETWIGPVFDDTSLNGIILYCGDPFEPSTVSISSSVGAWGRPRNLYRCGPGEFITGFQLKVEKGSAIDFDETATNNIRFYCGGNLTYFIEADGETWGTWREARHCPGGVSQRVCGIQTQVQPDRGALLDDTALNNVALDCCDVPAEPTTTELEPPTTQFPTTTETTTTTTQAPTTTTTTATSTEAPSTTLQPEPTAAPPQCPPTSDTPIYFPDPYSCDHYYICSNGQAILMQCAITLWWDQNITQCVLQNTIPCNYTSTTRPQLNH